MTCLSGMVILCMCYCSCHCLPCLQTALQRMKMISVGKSTEKLERGLNRAEDLRNVQSENASLTALVLKVCLRYAHVYISSCVIFFVVLLLVHSQLHSHALSQTRLHTYIHRHTHIQTYTHTHSLSLSAPGCVFVHAERCAR